jgi:hypothetical protein
MTHVQTRHIEGIFTTTSAAAQRAIAIPLPPKDGAWSITGHLIAANAATPRTSVTYFPQLSGACEGGVVTPNGAPKNKSQPADGSRAQVWAPGGPALVVTGQQVEIELTGLENTTIVWGWSFDVVVLELPAQAPSNKPATA